MEVNNKCKFRTIMVDPPWDVQQKGKNRGAIKHYPLMTLDQIKALPVADLAEPDAHIWLWTTAATLRHGYDVLESWSFTARSVFCWIKPRLGLGNYLRNCAEFMIFGTRGNAPVQYRAQPNWLFMSSTEHSHKPEEQYAIIERVSPGPYLELFARRDQPGWKKWGNEVISDIDIPGYPVPRVRGRDEECIEAKVE